jgi:hypothetical protein
MKAAGNLGHGFSPEQWLAGTVSWLERVLLYCFVSVARH